MNGRIIRTLVAKDLSLFFRNRFFALITVLGLAMFIVMYFILPSSADETYDIGIYAPDLPPAFSELSGEGFSLAAEKSQESLKNAVLDGDYIAGVVLPADIMETFAAGETAEVTIYYAPDVPVEAQEAIELAVKELAFMQTGNSLSVELSGEVLGNDTIGQPIAPRDRMRPMLAVFILMMEILTLANLVAEEVEQGTARALMVTPMTVTDFFTAKGITGTGMAFVQGVLFMLIVGGLSHQPALILLALFIGALLATGVAFLVASAAKDFMTVLGWGMLTLIVLVIPAIGVMFPGLITGWIKIIPTYYLVDTVHRAANYGSGWDDLWPNLLILLGWCAVVVWLGIAVLRRKFR